MSCGNNRGFSLIEVMIGTLLMGLVATSVFGVALSTSQNSGRIGRKTAASLVGRKIMEQLKNYVTADTIGTTGPGAAPNGWGFPGDDCACYAFSTGTHNLDATLWLPELAGPPYNAKLSYTVTNAATGNGNQPTVSLNIGWNAP